VAEFQLTSGNDVFHVIGFTRDHIASGLQLRTLRLTDECLKAGSALNQKLGPLALAAQKGFVVKKLVEVYFLDPFSFFDDDSFEKEFGSTYQIVEFYNETALERCKHYGT
jgi:hypothetical protein